MVSKIAMYDRKRALVIEPVFVHVPGGGIGGQHGQFRIGSDNVIAANSGCNEHLSTGQHGRSSGRYRALLSGPDARSMSRFPDYASSVLERSLLVPYPPVISTSPLGSKVAACSWRAVFSEPVFVHNPVPGLYTSEPQWHYC